MENVEKQLFLKEEMTDLTNTVENYNVMEYENNKKNEEFNCR